MSLKDRLRFKLTKAFYWRACMWLCWGIALVMAVLLWFGGTTETEEALKANRRILIRISDGVIEKAAAPSFDEEEAQDTATPTAEKTGTHESPESLPEAKPALPEAVATPTGVLPPEPEAPVPASTASVPLNPIKDSLREKLAMGTLPIIGPDGTRPWHYYAKPYTHQGSNPMIAVVITGLGQNKVVTEAAIKLPENVTLAFSPYAKDVGTWSNAARASGHEVMLTLPLEPTNYPAADPGPYGLLVGKSKEENASRLQYLLGRIQGYTGFATPVNEAYSGNDENFRLTLELLNVRGLMLLMPHEPARSETRKILDESKIAYTIADIVIDEELDPGTIQARMTMLEKAAAKKGLAVGYARATPLTLKELQRWTSELEKRGYALVPVTYITSRKFKP